MYKFCNTGIIYADDILFKNALNSIVLAKYVDFSACREDIISKLPMALEKVSELKEKFRQIAVDNYDWRSVAQVFLQNLKS